MKLWVDDLRINPDGWQWVKDAESAITFLEIGIVTHLSLDHDLGENSKTGYDIMNWIEERVYTDKSWNLPRIKFHTANPTGRRNMNAALLSIKKMLRNRK